MRKDTVHLILFLAIMAGIFAGLFFVGRARGDEFADRIAALEAKNAAKKPPAKADPFPDEIANPDAKSKAYPRLKVVAEPARWWKPYYLCCDTGVSVKTLKWMRANPDLLEQHPVSEEPGNDPWPQWFLVKTDDVKPDPFSRGNHAHAHATAPNYTHWYQHGTGYGSKFVCDCGCIETGPCACKNCCTPAKTRKIDEQPARADCGCSGRDDCTCPRGACSCMACQGMTATDPLIRASDGNLYPRSAWGPEMPARASWGPLGGFNGQLDYQPAYSAPRFFGGFRGGSGGCGPSGCH